MNLSTLSFFFWQGLSLSMDDTEDSAELIVMLLWKMFMSRLISTINPVDDNE